MKKLGWFLIFISIATLSFASDLHKHTEALKSSNPKARQKAANTLGKYEYENSKEAIYALLDALQDPAVQKSAINALGWICHDKSVFDNMISEKFKKVILDHKDHYVKQKAIEIIERIGNDSMVPVLLDVIQNDKERYVTYAAADALANIADESVIPPLINMLKEQPALISKEDFSELVKDVDGLWKVLIEKGYIDQNGAIQRKAFVPFTFTGDKDILSLTGQKNALEISGLFIGTYNKIPNQTRQAAAAHALGKIGNKSAIPALTEVLERLAMYSSPGNPAKEAAIDALLVVEDKSSLFPKLIKALSDESSGIREKAVKALGDFGDQDRSILIKALENLLEDNDSLVRRVAAISLGRIGDYSALSILMLVLKEDRDFSVRESAAWALGKIGDEGAVQALIRANSEDSELEVREAAKKALKTIDSKEARKALAMLPETTEEKLEKAFQKFPEATSVFDYYKFLFDKDPFVRAAAASGIEKMRTSVYFGPRPDEKIMARLAEMATEDLSPIVKINASYAYFVWFIVAKEGTLGKIAKDVVGFLDSNDPYLRKHAFFLCDHLNSLANYHNNKELGNSFIEALVQKIKKTNDEEARKGAKYFLDAASYAWPGKKVLGAMVESDVPPYRLIIKSKAREYIPYLKQRLPNADEEESMKIKATLMALGEDIYEPDDFSLPNITVINFWRAIERGDIETAKRLLDPARLDEETMNEIINDHKEVLRHFDFYELGYSFDEEFPSSVAGISCDGKQGYGSKKFGMCVENAYSVGMGLPGDGVWYYLRPKEDGTWIIHEIKGKISKCLEKALRK